MSAVAAAGVKTVRIAAVLKPLDFGVLGIALSITLFSAVAVYARRDVRNRILIEGPHDRWIFPPDRTETVAVAGPLGETVVEIRDNQVWVQASPCGNQTCVAAGPIRQHGQWIACLPNHVLVSITSAEQHDELDAGVW